MIIDLLIIFGLIFLGFCIGLSTGFVGGRTHERRRMVRHATFRERAEVTSVRPAHRPGLAQPREKGYGILEAKEIW